MPSLIVAANTISEPIVAPRGALVTVTPTQGASAKVEYTALDSVSAIRNRTATWAPWPLGAATSETTGLVEEGSYVRVTAIGGSVAMDIDENPSASRLAAFRTEWKAPTRWDPKILRNEALSRFFGCCGTNGLVQTSGQSTSSITMSVKMEVEAPFHAVRLLRIGRSGLNSLNGRTALVGVTESNDVTALNGLTASQNICAPILRVAGTPTAYEQLAPAGTVNGFQPVTWPGQEIVSISNAGTTATLTTKKPHGLVTGNTITLRDSDTAVYNVTAVAITVTSATAFTYTIASDPGASAVTLGSYSSSAIGVPIALSNQTYALSNLIPLQSAASRIDGGARPLFMYRFWENGTTQPFPFHSPPTGISAPTAAMRSRTIQIGAAFNNAVGTPGNSFSLGTTLVDVYPVISYSVPVLSVWGVGDSTLQNDALVTDKISSWLYRACLSVSTPQKPVVYANFGASGQSSATYWAQAKNCLAAGVAPPSVLFVGVDSVNDGVCTDATVQGAYALAQDVISTAKKYSIPVVVMLARMPLNTMNAAQYALKVAQDAALAALAAAHGVKFVTLNGLGDGANPERWIPALNYSADGYHPNEACIDSVLANQGAELLLSL